MRGLRPLVHVRRNLVVQIMEQCTLYGMSTGETSMARAPNYDGYFVLEVTSQAVKGPCISGSFCTELYNLNHISRVDILHMQGHTEDRIAVRSNMSTRKFAV